MRIVTAGSIRDLIYFIHACTSMILGFNYLSCRFRLNAMQAYNFYLLIANLILSEIHYYVLSSKINSILTCHNHNNKVCTVHVVTLFNITKYALR